MESLNQPPKTYFSGSTLKIIALLSMLVDHLGAFVLQPWINANLFNPTIATESYITLYNMTRAIGRLAFPLFAFLIVQGVIHTRNIEKYLWRLGLFALISEIPFDLARSQTFFDWQHQNVYFTLFLGLLTIAIMKRYSHLLIHLGTIIITGYISFILHTDYSYIGVLLIAMLYNLNDQRLIQSFAGGLYYLLYSPWGAPSFVLTYFYNGKRGKLNSRIFYLFYPVHLFILALIRYYFI